MFIKRNIDDSYYIVLLAAEREQYNIHIAIIRNTE
jgi:hypothetical protein